MKNIIKVVLLFTGALFLTVGCYKDKGNYEILEDKINSSSVVRSFNTILGDTLYVEPQINWKYPEEDTLGFDFEWVLIDSVISNKRELKYVVKGETGVYPLFLHIRESETGIKYRYRYNLSVNTPYQEGWLILTKDEQGGDLNFVRKDIVDSESRYASFKNIYSQNYNDILGSQPIKLISEIFPSLTTDEVLVIQKNKESVFLNGMDFSKVNYLENLLPEVIKNENIQPIDYRDYSSTNYLLLENGDLLWKINSVVYGGVHEGKFFSSPMYFSNGNSISTMVHKIFYNLSKFILMFDDLNYRFLGVYFSTDVGPALGSKLMVKDATEPPENFVNLNNMDGYELIYSGDYVSGNNFVNIIKESATGKFYYQTFTTRLMIREDAIHISEHHQEEFSGSQYINDDSVFLRIRKNSYLFFSSGSRLYYYDVNTKLTKLYFDFKSGDIRKIVSNNNGNELGVGLSSGEFHVCDLKNETLAKPIPGEGGGLLYSVNDLDEVIDVVWKWGSKNTFDRYL